jgi:hypothetical protein
MEWEMRVTFSKKSRQPGQFMQKINRIAGDLNVVLLVFAVGLATLDLTFLVTQKVVDRLPQVTRLVPDQDVPVRADNPSPQK